jgi:IMP dehydrogenase/GMP reductase
MPKTINFDLEKDFNITLKKCSGGNYKSGFRYENYVNLKPNYELGYIFGTFLGDGCSRTITNKKRRSNSVNWYFGKNELEIAIKLNECVEKIFGRSTNIRETKNTPVVTLHDKPFADFLSHFGKRDNKHLPEEFLVLNKFYLQGLFDGLIDSDGNISKNNRISLHNSSKKIIELFGVINYILQGYFPNVAIRNPTVGGLKNCNIENVKTTYNSRLLKRPDYRFTKNYQIVKILKKESLEQEVEVFDLEIDDDTHSFIANNSIVHNSVCLTKNVTGVTLPQFSCIQDCHAGKMIAENTTGRKITLIADGGIREIGDICKAIGQGADFVMSGKLFAGCIEAPGKGIYRGSASSDVQTKYRTDKEYVPTPEGTSIKVEQTNESVLQLIEHVAGGLRSAYSYSNARNTGEFQTKVLFGIRHNKT